MHRHFLLPTVVTFFCFYFSLLAGAPVVTDVSPTAGPTSGGNAVSIIGSGFTGATAVRFGSTTALSFVVNSDNLITAVAPPAIFGTVNITVTTPAGTSAATQADLYVYQGIWTAYVTDQSAGQISPIAIPSNTVGAPITVTGDPVDIAITPDGSRAYVSNNTLNRVDVIDILTNTLLTSIPVGINPIGVAITPDGQRVYVANRVSNTVSVIQTSTNTVSATLGLPGAPFGVAITPDGTKALVTVNSGGTGLVIPINTATNTGGAPINLGAVPLGFLAISPNGQNAYICRQSAGPLFVINIPGNTLTTTIPLLSPAAVPFRVAITPDGTRGYVTNLNGLENNVYPLDLLTNTSGTPIPVGIAPFGIAITPDGATAYVGDSAVSMVTPIDLATNTAGTPIIVPSGPSIVAITPDQAPLASFIATTHAPGTATTFDASASASPVGSIISYAWNFGDGQTAVTSSPFISHTYAAPGFYNVVLVVTNSAGTSTSQIFTGMTMLQNGGPNAIFIQTISVSAGQQPLPPSNFHGRVIKNEFSTQTDYIHQLTWQPSPDPTIIGYLIRRNGILIAETCALGPFVFNDHNRKKREIDVYTLTAFSAGGESLPLTLTLP